MADNRPALDRDDVDQLLADERHRFERAVFGAREAQAHWHSRAIAELETYRSSRWPELNGST